MKYDVINKNNNKRLDFLYIDIGKTCGWGYPADVKCKNLWPNYSRLVFEKYESQNDIDVILIDGCFRVACALMSIKYCPEATIMIHDFPNRPDYHVFNDFFEIIEKAGTLCVFKTKMFSFML
jgi:hypothetical protein